MSQRAPKKVATTPHSPPVHLNSNFNCSKWQNARELSFILFLYFTRTILNRNLKLILS
jgi:hypothetical protein